MLCREDQPLVYMEDVGRHNAVDKIAGWMLSTGEEGTDKILYTTGRLTSEMVIKTAMMGIPVLVSRSGFTAWGVEIAREVGLTLIGRMRGQRYVCLAGEDRLTPRHVRRGGPGGRQETPPEKRRVINETSWCNSRRRPPLRAWGGGDKGRLEIDGQSLLTRVRDRLAPQVAGLALNANGDADRFDDLGLPVVARQHRRLCRALGRRSCGPRLGSRTREQRRLSPLLPTRRFSRSDLVDRLLAAACGASTSPWSWQPHRAPADELKSGGGKRVNRHPTFGLWPVSLRDDLRAELQQRAAQGGSVDRQT